MHVGLSLAFAVEVSHLFGPVALSFKRAGRQQTFQSNDVFGR